MTKKGQENISSIREYLAALPSGEIADTLARFFAEDAVEVEISDQLNPRGHENDLATLLSRSVQGQQLRAFQHDEILNELAGGERAAIEATLAGTLALPMGELAAGHEMRAHLTMSFECRHGRIARQHNFDGLDPW